MKLYPYQQEALEAVVTAPERGIHRPMVVLPTGMGKTVVFSSIAKELNTRTLVLAHREELLTQAKEKMQQVWKGASIGIVQAQCNETDRQVVIGSIPTLKNEKRLQQIGKFGLIIVDEAHHTAADSYLKVLRGLGSFSESPPLTVGVTATPKRGDGEGLDEIFQEIVYEKDILYGIENGYLADLRGVSCKLEVDFKQLKTLQGDFQARSSHQLLESANAPRYAVEAYQQHAAGKKGIVFTPTVDMAKMMVEEFQRQEISADYVSGNTPKEERHAILQQLAEGSIQMIANCGVLTEGFDQPDLECVIIARPTQSQGLYIQMVGRGTRTAQGKTHCTVIDLVGASERHDLVTMASLYGSKSGETIQEAAERQAKEQEEAERMDLEEMEKARLVSRVLDLFKRSSYTWKSYDDKFYLSYADGTLWLNIKKNMWHVFDRKRDGRAYLIGAEQDIEKARLSAEKHVNKYEYLQSLNNELRKASVKGEPATRKQMNFLKWKGIPYEPGITKETARKLIATYHTRGA